MRIYLDTSALVKLIVAEKESHALRVFLDAYRSDTLFTGALARTELLRAVAPGGTTALAAARRLLDGLDTVALTRKLLDDAGNLRPAIVRSLDAMHLVAAQRASHTRRTVITYDRRMLAAASELGLETACPR